MASAGGSNKPIAFLAVRTDGETGHFVGAVLVTDVAGVPKEFRCTDAISPTPIQRLLYGKSLEAHVFVDLCAKPLLCALTVEPAIVVVDSKLLLAVGQYTSCPVLHVERDVDHVRAALRSEIDPVEPFRRIDEALTSLAKEDERYR